jgi:uncharacterized membrane protein (TIGR02234 family)
MTEARSGRFGSVVLAGLATAGLSSVASGKAWYTATVDYKLAPGVPDPDKAADMPLALALSLVVLAGWGALLVSRGRARRFVAGVALVAAAGVVVCVAIAPFTLPDQVRDRLPAVSGGVEVSPTGWFAVAGVAGVLSLAVLVLAWLRSPQWPTMSSRYDAPGAEPAALRPDTDLWKALDEGRDPTDPIEGPRPSSP